MIRKAGGRGSGLIEFTLLILVLMLLALGVFDFGLAIEQGIVVSAAAYAGAEYGAAEGNLNDTVGMQTAAVHAASGLGITANPSTFCTCSPGSTNIVSCTIRCNTYDLPIQYVQVQASVTVPVLFRFSGLPLNIPLSATAVLRAR
jgi:Flp pilus assembly protein TadG